MKIEGCCKKIEGPCEKMSLKAVAEALYLMKQGKAARPSGVAFHLLKVCKNDNVKKLAEVADELLQGKSLKAGEGAI